MSRPDKHNALRVREVTSKKVVSSSPAALDLNEVKQVAKAAGEGVTVNDVLLAAFVRMLRSWFEEVGETEVLSGKRAVRLQFPINIRTRKEGAEDAVTGDPNNRFSFGFFTFPAKATTAAQQIAAVKSAIDKVKVSPSAIVQARILPGVLATTPRSVLASMLRDAVNAPCVVGAARNASGRATDPPPAARP